MKGFMRIAFFHNLPPGGGKRSAYEWIKRMAQNHEVDLYLYDPQAEDFLDVRPFVRKTILVSQEKTAAEGYIGRLVALHRVRVLSKQVAQRINDDNYDLAFVMQCKASNSPFILRHLRIPSLYFCHETLTRMLEPHYPGKWKEGRLAPLKQQGINWLIALDRANAIRATLICTSSLYSRENIYRAYGLYPRLNYPGVDVQHFHPLSLQREPIVLCVGSLVPSKGHDFVIKSIGTLNGCERPSVKIIYSSIDYKVDYRKQFAHLAKRLGVSVSFNSLITDEDLVDVYNRASITACPNLLEPLGLVPLESMACGTPVVGVAEAGIRETVQHNETGLLTERDPREFGQAIEKLMKNKLMWTGMGSLGRQRVLERWTWEQSYQQLEKHMQMIVTKD
jgi:glycosyltransferase involved in cell wall biosynthesis